MITICTRWETTQMSSELEWHMWRTIKGAFSVNRFVFIPKISSMQNYTFEQFDSMEEALESCTGKRIFLEPKGKYKLSYLTSHKDDDIVLVLGNCSKNNLDLIRPEDVSIRIESNKPSHLYGTNAAAIALAYRYGQ